MFQNFINGITDGAIMWMTVTGSMLFPEVIPIVLCAGMLLMYCKNPNFMDLERERYEMMMEEDEETEYCSTDEEEYCYNNEDSLNQDVTTNVDILRNEINTLEAEIAELKSNIEAVQSSNLKDENNAIIDNEKSDTDKKND